MTKIYNNFNDFMIKHGIKPEDNRILTHTRIGDKEKIYGGSYSIDDEENDIFMNLYYNHVFIKNNKEYLTEKQINNIEPELENGPILIDLDFRYDENITDRQHTKEHVMDIIFLYLEELKNLFLFQKDTQFYVYIMEKPNVNIDCEKKITKDGIHILIGLQSDHILQEILRKNIIEKIGEICDLPVINTWEEIIDIGICKGTTNWQLYGSRKPNNEAYTLKYYFEIKYDNVDNEFMIEEQKISNFNIKTNINKLSARYKNNPKLEKNPSIMNEYNKYIQNTTNKKNRISNMKSKIKFISENNDIEENNIIVLEDIINENILEKAVKNMLHSLSNNEYYIKEIHEYTQILPEQFYNPGSHTLNRQVAFALKNTDEKLFLSWVMLRSKAEDFDYSTIPNLYKDWKKYFNKSNGINLTKQSIKYWCKQYCYEKYEEVRIKTIDYLIDESILSSTEYDFALVLYQMYSEKYICASILNTQWYVFKNHRWEKDPGNTLRLSISKHMYQLYANKMVEMNIKKMNCTNEEETTMLDKKIKRLYDISMKTKRTCDKNNIIREAMELFYDNNFTKNMDSNKYLLGCNNGVIDFKENKFRDGMPTDYITKTTGLNYIDNNDEEYKHIKKEILDFMTQLFPIDELNRYMWEHLASSLIGSTINQTLNIYKGSGSNGKSMLVDLMSQALGDYKSVVPITLVTDKRTSIGGTSSEIMQLKGVRYAIMQEPSKDMKLNEGILKELTGGDPLQGRSLYSQSETFIPQFTLAVCTNVDLDIHTNDDGTWRRMRRVPFYSKFINNDETHTDNTKYIFPKDKKLKEKFPIWAPVFLSMLIDIAFKTNGNVKDCDIVLEESNNYRKSQDHISAFLNDMIIKTEDKTRCIKKKELLDTFKIWFQENASHNKMPKVSEINEHMERKYGKCINNKWTSIYINHNFDSDEED